MKFLLFSASWCAPCKAVKQRISNMEMNAQLDTSRLSIIDIEDPEGNRLAKQYNIKGVPTIIQVDDEGTAVNVHVGNRTEDQLKQIFNTKI